MNIQKKLEGIKAELQEELRKYDLSITSININEREGVGIGIELLPPNEVKQLFLQLQQTLRENGLEVEHLSIGFGAGPENKELTGTALLYCTVISKSEIPEQPSGTMNTQRQQPLDSVLQGPLPAKDLQPEELKEIRNEDRESDPVCYKPE